MASAMRAAVKERPAASAGMQRCRYCEMGFRRVNGIHIGGQRKGMIPNQPCELVFAVRVALLLDGKAYWAYVDGEPIKSPTGIPRRYKTAASAYRAACRMAPFKEHV